MRKIINSGRYLSFKDPFIKVMKAVFSLVLVTLFFKESYAQNNLICNSYYIESRADWQHIDLSDNWSMTYSHTPFQNIAYFLQKKNWIRVVRPTSIQWALYKAGKLPYPYKGYNYKKYQWVNQQIWYYKKTFSISKKMKGNYIYLKCNGIDYFSKVWVNGIFVGSHEGMFGGPTREISKWLHYGTKQNTILIEVRSANFYKISNYVPRSPGKIIMPWYFAKGTESSPFFAVGLWRGISLEIVPKINMELPYMVTNSLSQDNKTATIAFKVAVCQNHNILNDSLHSWTNSDKDLNAVPKSEPINKSASLGLSFYWKGRLVYQRKFHLNLINGTNWVQRIITIPQPKLWWPNGLGKQNLYTVYLRLFVKGQPMDELSFKYGIRTITHSFTPGPKYQPIWYPWQLMVNGQKIFTKGVDWMPADVLLNLPKEKYERLLILAKDAGIQMLRVWGGGLLETNTFYNLCDSLGLMVWQDFPIANYTTSQWPLNVWSSQVTQNIFRLRNHASLVDYCGGNEFNPYGEGNTAAIGVLERDLRIFDPSRMFIMSSPNGGSIHVYPDIDPSLYNEEFKEVPNIAETGIHCIADPADIYRIIDSSEVCKGLSDIFSREFAETHPEFIKHFAEYNPGRVPRMLSRTSGIINIEDTPSLESLSEASQVASGEFYQILSEKIQSDYPVTAGLMPWVFNRSLPQVAAIQLVDGNDQPLAPYYFLKRTYNDIHIMLDIKRLLWKPGETFPLSVKVLNLERGTESINDKVILNIYNEKFDQVYSRFKDIIIKKNPSVSKVNFGDFDIPSSFRNQYFFIRVVLKNQRDQTISSSVYWPLTTSKMNDTAFYIKYTTSPTPWPTFKSGPWLMPIVGESSTELGLKVLFNKEINIHERRIEVQITNEGAKPSFMTRVLLSGVQGSYSASDNYFWLPSGETRNLSITILGESPVLKHNSVLYLKSWNASTVERNLQ